MSTVPNRPHIDDPVLAGLTERYRVDPNRAAWFAVGAARQALAAGQPARAARVLNALAALNTTQGGEVQ